MCRVIIFNDPDNTNRGDYGDLDIIEVLEDGVSPGLRIEEKIGKRYLLVEITGVKASVLRDVIAQDRVSEILGTGLDDHGAVRVYTRERLRKIRKFDLDPTKIPALTRFRRMGTVTVTEQQFRDFVRTRSTTKDSSRTINGRT